MPGLEWLQLSVTTSYVSAPHKVAELCLAEHDDRVIVLCCRSLPSDVCMQPISDYADPTAAWAFEGTGAG